MKKRWRCLDEEPAERKRPEQPALAAFVMPDAPPAPMLEEPVAAPAAAATGRGRRAGAAWPALTLLQRAENIFSGAEEAKPAEVQVEKKAEEKPERQQERRKPRPTTAAIATTAVITATIVTTAITARDNAEGREPRESREENRRNRRENSSRTWKPREFARR
jgi:ribonuclease E